MTAHYLIDGYNLFFRTAAGQDGSSFRQERDKTIQLISAQLKVTGFAASLVFDAAWQEGPSEKHVKGDLEIIYTDSGESADDWIVNEVKRSLKPSQLIVVTSDRKLAWRARMKGALTLTVEDFLKLVRRVARKKLAKPVEAKLPPKLVQREKPPTLNERYEKLFEEKTDAPQIKQKKETPISDYERWLKAFENGA